jgi:ankyrin repeat protein
VLYGFIELARHLIVAHREDVNDMRHDAWWAPFHGALYNGHFDLLPLFFDHGADNLKDKDGEFPLVMIGDRNNFEAM